MPEISLEEAPKIIHTNHAIHGRRPIEKHHLPQFWSLHLYYYDLKLTVNKANHEITAGSVSLIPPDSQMEFYFDRYPSYHLYSIFKSSKKKTTIDLPLVFNPQTIPNSFEHLFSSVIQSFEKQPQAATSYLHSMLWSLAQVQMKQTYSGNPLVNQVCHRIDSTLAHPITISELAAEFEVSHNHLTRQFQKEFGQSIVQYITVKRMKKAHRLLRTTLLPIKLIAQECGYPDQHAFNKAFRKYYGVAPSQTNQKRRKK